jgi:hypothetical protein
MHNIPIDIFFYVFNYFNLCELLQVKACNNKFTKFINSYENKKIYITKIIYNKKKNKKLNWRIRYSNWVEMQIYRNYKYSILTEIHAKVMIDDLIYTNIFSAYRKGILFNKWNIYDDNKKLIAYIKNTKGNKWKIFRLDNSEWCNIMVNFGHRKPRQIKIQNINNKEYENPVQNQNNIIYKNLYPTLNGKVYNIKFSSVKIRKSSIKNCKFICPINESNFLEFGKMENEKYILRYKYPFHGLFAFALSIVMLDF